VSPRKVKMVFARVIFYKLDALKDSQARVSKSTIYHH